MPAWTEQMFEVSESKAFLHRRATLAWPYYSVEPQVWEIRNLQIAASKLKTLTL